MFLIIKPKNVRFEQKKMYFTIINNVIVNPFLFQNFQKNDLKKIVSLLSLLTLDVAVRKSKVGHCLKSCKF
jgi:hypothetical protein